VSIWIDRLAQQGEPDSTAPGIASLSHASSAGRFASAADMLGLFDTLADQAPRGTRHDRLHTQSGRDHRKGGRARDDAGVQVAPTRLAQTTTAPTAAAIPRQQKDAAHLAGAVDRNLAAMRLNLGEAGMSPALTVCNRASA
jgi:hypothetical protein